jgi:hypothetical protein
MSELLEIESPAGQIPFETSWELLSPKRAIHPAKRPIDEAAVLDTLVAVASESSLERAGKRIG